jgi:MFS family permease
LLVCNMDRICMSVAVIPMSQSFGWSPSVQGFVGSAFLWGYMATQLLGGEAADWYGGRKVISFAIAFFSLASMLPTMLSQVVPAAHFLTLVMLSRFLGAYQRWKIPSSVPPVRCLSLSGPAANELEQQLQQSSSESFQPLKSCCMQLG